MSKPFSIQSPEVLAKEYGGNKQKLAQAMQLGVVDPTAGVLAGMFIDRMRAAQMQEQVPQATVAQQVMGGAPAVPPPAPSGGLGAPPQLMPQAAPPMAPPPPMNAVPMGMADGGLASLPVSDDMFDEPDNGGFDDGYAGGGLVAFAEGGDTTPGTGPKPPVAPTYYGYSMDPRQNMDIARELMGTPESKYSGELEKEFLETLSPEGMEKQRKGRMWEALTDIGFRLASSRNPSLLGAVGEAGMGALPAAREAKRLDKADQKFARKALADLEAGRNTQRAQLAGQAIQMQQMAIQGYEAETGRKFQASEKKLDRDLEWRIASMREAGANSRAAISASSDGTGTGRGETVTANRYSELQEKYLGATKDFNAAKAAWIRMGRPREDDKSPTRAAVARAYIDAANLRKSTADMWSGARLRGAPAKAAAPSAKGGNKRPASVTEAEWNAMTPQERALFQ